MLFFSHHFNLHIPNPFSAELGDYDARKHPHGYVSEFNFLSNQTRDLEIRVSELHQQLKGMSPSQAELNYLDKVKWHDMYGIDLHPVLVSGQFFLLTKQKMNDKNLMLI